MTALIPALISFLISNVRKGRGGGGGYSGGGGGQKSPFDRDAKYWEERGLSGKDTEAFGKAMGGALGEMPPVTSYNAEAARMQKRIFPGM